MSKNELTATNLKNQVWETMQKLRSGEIDIKVAVAVFRGADSIVRANKEQRVIAQILTAPLPPSVVEFGK